ncbi:MAG: shikimate kinase [Deltaproteobacteria bacterium]|nr:shikimate kinase [Deltaproteobacteria bacterium]
MANVPNNLALIGMPGAGKSTLGVLLAKRTARSFLDSDLLIQQAEGTSLQEIIEQRGIEVFRHIEERVVLEIDCSDAVIATGGSVVYSEIAMEHLGRLGKRIFLDVPLAELDRRLGNLDTRGVIRGPGQDLDGLLAERRPLYERWADIRVDCGGLEHDGVVSAVIRALAPA